MKDEIKIFIFSKKFTIHPHHHSISGKLNEKKSNIEKLAPIKCLFHKSEKFIVKLKLIKLT